MSADPVSSQPSASGPSQPASIRSQLSPDLAAIFDREWESVLEAAKRTQDLQAIHDLLNHWRHFAAAEVAEPGSYFRVQALAEQVLAAGSAEAAGIRTYDGRAVIEERLRELDRRG
ncbi:MAG: DUF6247 family protein [Sporichthyaceae bacterium]